MHLVFTLVMEKNTAIPPVPYPSLTFVNKPMNGEFNKTRQAYSADLQDAACIKQLGTKEGRNRFEFPP